MKWLPLLVALATAAPASAQVVPGLPVPRPYPAPPPPTDAPGPRRLGGPRTGITVLSPGVVETINEAFDYSSCYEEPCEDDGPRVDPALPVITQFGWEYERQMFQAQSGLTGVTEWVLLAGGVERGLFLPSATFLAGVRTPGGLEVGVGPNLSLSGAAYAVAVGMNNEVGEVNVPLNAAVVLGREGPRVSLLVGFNVTESRY